MSEIKANFGHHISLLRELAGGLHWKSIYKDWDDSEFEQLADRLMSIIEEHIEVFIASKSPVVADPKPIFSAYKAAAYPAIEAFSSELNLRGQTGTLVFAKHPEIDPDDITRFCKEAVVGLPRVFFSGLGSPHDVPELQVADFVTYEFSHQHLGQSRMMNRILNGKARVILK